MNFFKNVTSIDDLKKQYKKLAFQNHPDRGGNTEIMQKINSEYDSLLKNIINNAKDSDYSNFNETQKGFWSSKKEHSEVEIKVKQALDKIIHLDGLEIEIIGVWIWVSGETKNHKDVLKNAGYKWNKTMMKWVFIGKKSNGRGNMTLEQMREKHGSEKVKNTSTQKKLKIAC